jgi:signal transduction histidine kinase
LRTSAEGSALLEANAMARSFRSDILSGQIKGSELQMRRALNLKAGESIKVLDEKFSEIFAESEKPLWPKQLTDGHVQWTGLFRLATAVPVYFDQEGSALFGYVALNRNPAFNWSLLLTIFGSLMFCQFAFAWLYRHSMVRVGSSLTRDLESLAVDLGRFDSIAENASAEQISELNEVKLAFHRASKEIAALNASRSSGKNLRRVAHDIRSPLTAFSLGIKSLGDIPKPTRELLEMAYRRMEVIASDILSEKNHSTIEVSGLRKHFEELLTEKSAEHAAREVSWAFKFECEPGAAINVSLSTLMSTVSNLMNNAAEASPRAGMIRLEVRSNKTYFSVAVIDEGPGIPLSQQPFILAGGVTSKEKGNGIGLSSAKRFAEAHSGNLILTNRDFGFEVELTLALTGKAIRHEIEIA